MLEHEYQKEVSIYNDEKWNSYSSTIEQMSEIALAHISDRCCHCNVLFLNNSQLYYVLDMIIVGPVLHGNYVFHCANTDCLKGSSTLLRDKMTNYNTRVSTLCAHCRQFLPEGCKCCGACYLTSYCDEFCQKIAQVESKFTSQFDVN